MAKTPDNKSKSFSKSRSPDRSAPNNLDIDKIRELVQIEARLKIQVDDLKSKINEYQTEIDKNKEAQDKIKDKKSSDYKELKNKILLDITTVKSLRENLNKINTDLREVSLQIKNIGNISASKHVPDINSEESKQKVEQKRKEEEHQKKENEYKAKAKKLAEDFADDEKRQSLVLTDEDKKILASTEFKTELKKILEEKQKIENTRNKIAGKEVDKKDLTIDEQIERNIYIALHGEESLISAKEKIAQEKQAKQDAEQAQKDLEAQNLAKEEKTKKDIDTIAEKLATGLALSGAEKQQLKKYETEIVDLAKNKTEQAEKEKSMRESIISAEKEGKELTIEQKAFANRPGERSSIDNEKTKRAQEAAEAKAKADVEAAEAKAKADAEAVEAKAKKEREDFGKLDRAGKRQKAMERYQKMVENKTKDMDDGELRDFQYESQEKRNRANIRRECGYARAALDYQNILNNKEYQDLKKNSANLGIHQREVLAQYENRLNNAKTRAEQTGPMGGKYIDLESARRDLAQASQDYKQSFESKFFGSRALAGIGNMFGFKWSGIKEGANTKNAHGHLAEMQARYDNLRQKIMQGTIEEEYDVNKIIKIDNRRIADRMRDMVRNVDQNLITREHQKLEDLKHVLEETVKKPAFLQFANWYKNKYWGAIKNERVRRVVQRVTNAIVLSGAIWATGGLAGVAVGAAAGRALLSGAVGESAAAGFAGLAGGEKNDRGEFEKFAAKRDREREEAAAVMNRIIFEQINNNNRPDVSRTIFRDRVMADERANVNMQMSEMRTRKGEMWVRLLTGGALGGYLMNEMIPNPQTITPGPTPILPDPDINPLPDTSFELEGDFVDASPKGFIQSFMDLKKEMIAHYKGIDGGQFTYPEASEFAGLTDDQVVEKLLATGKFDDLTKDIMSAKTLPEFMKVAEEHGFWRPDGWGNSAVDSASVPAGSKIGMDVGTDGNMHFMMILPDGKHIPIDDNFGEALNQHIKGVGIIDTQKPGSFRGGVNPNPNVINNPQPNIEVDSSLDPGDMPPDTNPESAPGVVIDSRGADGVMVETNYFKDHPIDFSSRLNAYKSLIKNGYTVTVQGDAFTPMQVSDIDKINFDRATAFIVNGDKYFLQGFNNVPPGGKILQEDFVFGMDANGRYITMDDYNKFHNIGEYAPAPISDTETISVESSETPTADIETPVDENFEQILQKYEDSPRSQKAAHEFLDEYFGKDVGYDDVYGTEHLDETKSELWNDLKNEKIGHVHKALEDQDKIGAERLAYDDGGFYSKADMKQTNVFFNELVERYKKIYGSYPTSEKNVHDVVKAVAVGSAGSSR